MSIGEFFSVKRRICCDQAMTVFRYYKRPRFALIDLSYGLLSFVSNPYRTCRKFLQKKGEPDVYAYGETPYSTLEKIAAACQASPSDRWLELGSGRGKGCFWISQFIGCKTTGVEWIPEFVRSARFIKTVLSIKNLDFKLQNFEETDFSNMSIVYLYGTCLKDETITCLIRKMSALPKGARIVSVSYPLDSDSFILQKSFTVWFPWGETEAFLHHKK